MELRMLALLAVAAAPAVAHADRYEASVAAEVRGGIARIGERDTDAEMVPAFGLGGRVTHAWSNTLAWDLGLDATLTQPATFPDAKASYDGRDIRGAVTRRTATARAEVGGELRFGARLIPTVRLALGPQVRYRSASDVGAFADAVPSSISLDGVVALGVGLDLRLGRQRVIGLAVQLAHAQPLGHGESHDVITLTVRLSSYWYPRWWAPSW